MAVPKILYKLGCKILTAYYFVKIGVPLLLYYVTHPFTRWTEERPVPPKCLQGNQHGDHKFASINGIQVHYVEKGDQKKPLLIFVHGFPEFWYSWRFQLDEFSKNYWCVAMDNRGYGESSKPSNLKDYAIGNMVEDIKELALYLGRKRFTLVGHDWGALITWKFVDKYGEEMLEKFVALSGPSSEVWEKLVLSEWWQFRNSWYVFFMQNPCIPECFYSANDMQLFVTYMLNPEDPNCPITNEDIEAYKYTFGQKGAFTFAANYYRANYFMPGTERKLSKCPPGLFVLGENDAYISQSTTGLVKKKYDGLQTHVLKNAGHFIQQHNPIQVNKIMSDFLLQ